MPPATIPMSQFRFTFKLTGPRSAQAEVSAHGKLHQMFLSLWSCDLGPLALQVTDLLREPKIRDVTLSWFEEPGEARWVISRLGDNVTIRIYEFPDYKPHQDQDKGTPAFETECNLLRLSTQIKGQLHQLLTDYGHEGYQELTGVAFPQETLQELTRLINIHKNSL